MIEKVNDELNQALNVLDQRTEADDKKWARETLKLDNGLKE